MAEMTFGERLHHLRKQAHMTQQAVANAMNIHRTSYTKYETGVATPDQQGLLQLARLFGVSVDYLLGYDSNTDGNGGTVTTLKEETMELSLQEQLLIQMFRQLNYAEQQTLVRQMQASFRQWQNNRKK